MGMYNEQLEQLIDYALADGELTEKEKQVLFKKAEAMGVDLDEFEMVLEARLFEKQKEGDSNPDGNTAAPKSDKLGDIKKCPACGAMIQAFQTTCAECGYEFRGTGPNVFVKNLFDKLESVEKEISREQFKGGILDTQEKAEERYKQALIKRKGEIIRNYPIPQTKEDILEFLHFMSPKTKTGIGCDPNVRDWRKKFEEVLSRGEFAFSKDTQLKAELERFKQQYKSSPIASFLAWISTLSQTAKTLGGVAIGLIVFFSLMGVLVGRENKEIEQEKERLESIYEQCRAAIREKDYTQAKIYANQLIWEVRGENEKKAWAQKRKEMMKIIASKTGEKYEEEKKPGIMNVIKDALK